ncbi:MAG: Asp-tRNA(Asn)/Glu-tRNA(Gln) amidotransferase subunit GatB [Candidatus Dojkabacteria bacterium]|nr:Asp-tRNA(Asn)/Glu-tRNA(Gln) amidotransferase subunit GatB [Candidatus Dojkabacteria bacterium]MDD4561155.1 Asp-tRNA(Asn)/Glu-tRNA(Gln) amidotransferase subunit GatB [Candidatus Dojkabacteria bacterium]
MPKNKPSKIYTEKYDLIVGLEIHIQTNTQSKMFCTCPAKYFQKEPNTQVCPVCLGLPDAPLPLVNKRAIELCILMGLGTNCNIENEIHFYRKHYSYPDLAKGYQISQYNNPLCSNGYVETVDGVRIDIERIHPEEDVAKSTHHTEKSSGKSYFLIDYNKSSVPLIEIVTKPCIRTPKDAKDFATEVRKIARYLNISEGDMEKGQMRCEPNISVQEKGKWEYKDGKIVPKGNYKLNPKIEVKNIGSITAVEKSIIYERERLIKCIEEGEEIIQQTRGWDADRNITVFQRSKEDAEDYNYTPDPDIPIIEVSSTDIERISEELIELSNEKIKRYIKDWDISKYAAEVISSTKENAYYFEKLQKQLSKELSEKEAALEASNWLMGTIFAIGNLNIDIADLTLLILAFKNGIITKNKGEEILKDSLENGKDIKKELEKIKEEKENVTDNLVEIVKDTIKNNSKAVNDYMGGKESTLGFLVGQVMQNTKGTANPNDVRETLINELKK